MSKTMFIVVSAKHADCNYQAEVSVPQYLTCEAVNLLMKDHLNKKYRGKAYSEKPSHWREDTDFGCLYSDIFGDFQMFLDHLKNVKLYRLVVDKKLMVKEEVTETREFRLSHIFTLEDICFREDCTYVDEGITFFFVRKTMDIKDVIFNDADIRKTLGCRLAESGAYFLHGEWKFYRCTTKPSYWQAKKIEKSLEVQIIGEHLEVI